VLAERQEVTTALEVTRVTGDTGTPIAAHPVRIHDFLIGTAW
jgi:hypothetical protein